MQLPGQQHAHVERTEVSLPHDGGSSPLLHAKMPGLDALRGLAVLMVVLYHGLYWNLPLKNTAAALAIQHRFRVLSLGWLGVNLFFVLSGFLITGILLDSRSSPHYWRNFYVRRALRILPAFLLTLLVLKFTGAGWTYLLLCVAYLANMTWLFGIPPAYGVLWSLAVEEQFYLVWPALVRWLPRSGLLAVALGSLSLSPLLRGYSQAHGGALGDPHLMTWLISDNLAIGALVAIYLRARAVERKEAAGLAAALAVAGAGMLLVISRFGGLHRETPLGAALQTEPFLLWFAAMLLSALLLGDRAPWRHLSAPLRWLGGISYGLYLYHLLVFRAADALSSRLSLVPGVLTVRYAVLRFVIAFVAALLVSWLSRATVEEWFLRRKQMLAPYPR